MMKEQIAKLASQSGFDVSPNGKFGNYSEMHRLEKFAQSIIFECACVIVEGGKWQGGIVLDKLKEHFGVE